MRQNKFLIFSLVSVISIHLLENTVIKLSFKAENNTVVYIQQCFSLFPSIKEHPILLYNLALWAVHNKHEDLLSL